MISAWRRMPITSDARPMIWAAWPRVIAGSSSGADFARRHLDQRREALQRLVRREQVVIGRNDRYIRPDEAAQRLLVALAGGGKTMGEIGTAEPRPRGPCTARAAHAAEIVVARVLAARADARGRDPRGRGGHLHDG